MAKRKAKTMIYKTLHRKQTTKHHEPHNNLGWPQMEGKEEFESVNWKTENTMPQRKKDKRINSYIQNTTQKLNTNPTRNRAWTQVLRMGRQFLLHKWKPWCYSSHKPGDKSWISAYNKWNISLVMCDTYIP